MSRDSGPSDSEAAEDSAGDRPCDDQPAEARARVDALRAFADGVRTLPILVQTEPDPDAIGSAYAIRALLDRTEKTAPIVSLGTSRRPETRRMIELLDMPVTEVTVAETKAFERVVAVDVLPTLLRDTTTRLAVIDHHPADESFQADFLDIRPEYGAAATMLTEYLRAAGRRIGKRLATALLYGIRTDTALLTRGCTRDDVEAYAYLQELADLELLSRIDRPAYPRDTLARMGRALECAELRDDLAVLWMGPIRKNRAHLMPELADLSLNIEGVRWAAAAGVLEKSFVLNIRYLAETSPGAGDLARRVAQTGGSGGGHATMARVEIPLDKVPFRLDDEPDDEQGRHAAVGNGARIADWMEQELAAVRQDAADGSR